MQTVLFSQYLDPIKLKEGKTKCPCCERPMKAYGYNLDDKLVNLAIEVYEFCKNSKTKTFRPKDVFGEELRANTQFQKLKCHRIIDRTKNTGWWKLTKLGTSFLEGRVKLPRKVWVFADSVILEDDIYQNIWQIEPRWKEWSRDWILDYIPQGYNLSFNLVK